MRLRLLLVLCLLASFTTNAADTQQVLGEVRYKISAGDLSSADAITDEFCQVSGPTSGCAAAASWLARGAFLLKDPDKARVYLQRTKVMTNKLAKSVRVEDDYYLAIAIGAAIEVNAQLLASEGHTDQAVALLESELPLWKVWAIQARVQKNLDLLTLVGKPAPHLPAEAHGHPTLLFLWGHWCSDCTDQAPVIARIKQRFEDRGLRVLAPTRRHESYEDDNVTPEKEDAAIERVWKESYSGLAGVPHAADRDTMLSYGVSSTPTLVLVDRAGIVRMYAPVRMSESALASRIEPLLQ